MNIFQKIKQWYLKWYGPKNSPSNPIPSTPVPTDPTGPINGEHKVDPPWYSAAKKYEGKKETDSSFSSFMVPFWQKLFGMKGVGTIATNWAAWCGLAMAVALWLAGLPWQKDGELAMNWDKYGVAIEWHKNGIPKGAILRLNHGGDCESGSGNHVTQANGDCAPEDLGPGSFIDGFGGNQSNTWKVSTYSVKEICSVRWPKEYPFPSKVTKSINCSSEQNNKESTR